MIRFFKKCPECDVSHFLSFLKLAHYVCNKCGYNFNLKVYSRIGSFCDRGSFHEFDKDMKSVDPLEFPNYRDRLDRAVRETKHNEAMATGMGKIGKFPTTLGVMNADFIMASMGSVVGEKITRMLEYSAAEGIPAILVVCSGGARMQEGIFSLMQMAKTAAAVKKLNDQRLPLFTVLTHPTTGGVAASFAMLGNIIIAEPKALIGFAGPRVIEQTIGANLPKGFQRSEFLLEHGMIDMVVERKDLRKVLAKLLKIHSKRAYNT